ncbi:hypothetical protein [Pinirhizobacter soli]|uniref:hypothetical protein n=1 Tax=Pinirhizobacter soli TaxID=2786953 RepID=UPI00202A707E|nr:hypothetical protein [Pinirhizobacter soli]
MRIALMAVSVMLAVAVSAEPAKKLEDMTDAEKVVKFTAFLEAHPFDPNAAAMQVWLLDWEDKSKDVVDVVCPGVVTPLMAKHTPNASQLMRQYIFGSAASQLIEPARKDQLLPNQVAGVHSMILAYRSMIATHPGDRIPFIDDLSQKDEQGQLEETLKPIVKPCSSGGKG